MNKLSFSAALAAIFLFSLSIASAQTLSGTVTNATTGKPAAGDQVVLISLSNGMQESGTTKADLSGKFSFKLPDAGGPHLIRAIHQGVTYHQMAPPGTDSVQVQVYDAVKKLTEVAMTADVLRLQADNSALQGIRLLAVDNTSSPPRTQTDHFEFYLPPGANIESTQAKAPNGQPIAAEAIPQKEKNRYAIEYPLRPGETQFQVQFTMPYTGSIQIDPKPLYAAQHFVVVLPKSMHFQAASDAKFQSMQDPNQGDTMVEVAQQTQPGQPLGFTVTGTGTISDEPAQTASGAAQAQGNDNRPGGGLGAPIDAPDPLQKYRWYILGGIAIVLAAGAWVVMKRQPVAATAGNVVTEPAAVPKRNTAVKTAAAPSGVSSGAASASSDHASMLLQALKEEIFQLEIERKTGKVTQAEYDRTKAALDQTLDRALKRKN